MDHMAPGHTRSLVHGKYRLVKYGQMYEGKYRFVKYGQMY